MEYINYEFFEKTVEDLERRLVRNVQIQVDLTFKIDDLKKELESCVREELEVHTLLDFSEKLRKGMEAPEEDMWAPPEEGMMPPVKEEISEALGTDEQSREIKGIRNKWIDREEAVFSFKFPATDVFLKTRNELKNLLREFLGNIREEGKSILKNSNEIWAVNTTETKVSVHIKDCVYWDHSIHILVPISDFPFCLTGYSTSVKNLRNSSDVKHFVKDGILVLMTSEQKDEYLKILQMEVGTEDL